MTTAALRRPVDGYGDVAIMSTPDGPAFDRDVPDHIGVYDATLAELVPALGEWHPRTGDLRLLDVWFRQIGVDGPDILVFERIAQ